MATPRYFSATYWAANYWEPDYFAQATGGERIGQIATTATLAETAGTGGEYWGSNYYSSTYWSSSYWAASVAGLGSPFLGTVSQPGTIVGTLDASTDAVASFTGSAVQVQFLDWTLEFSLNWTATDFPGFAGSSAVALSDDTGSLTGTFLPAGGVLGSMSVALGAETSNFDGTMVAPANRSGIISTATDNSAGAMTGQFFGPGSSLGSMAATLDDYPLAASGTAATWSTSGSIAYTIEDFSGTLTVPTEVTGTISSTTDGLQMFAFGNDGAVVNNRVRAVMLKI